MSLWWPIAETQTELGGPESRRRQKTVDSKTGKITVNFVQLVTCTRISCFLILLLLLLLKPKFLLYLLVLFSFSLSITLTATCCTQLIEDKKLFAFYYLSTTQSALFLNLVCLCVTD